MNILSQLGVLHLTIDGTNYVLAAGTTDVNSQSVDLAQYASKRIAFLVALGTIAASGAGTIKVQHSDDNTNFVDVEGTSQAWVDTDDDKVIGVEIHRPLKRYLRVVTTRGDAGNSTINGIFALVSDNRTQPFTQLVTAGQFVRQPEIFASAPTGTA
jgi:hypothetical protein